MKEGNRLLKALEILALRRDKAENLLLLFTSPEYHPKLEAVLSPEYKFNKKMSAISN